MNLQNQQTETQDLYGFPKTRKPKEVAIRLCSSFASSSLFVYRRRSSRAIQHRVVANLSSSFSIVISSNRCERSLISLFPRWWKIWSRLLSFSLFVVATG
ncbi:unnamed protein product [Linum trigynum]|uniref:Uncharacterized protein n=1 Tax=Linum trigynum TaxID=586398 RepID=A0AAV2EVG6_9ROSI